MGPKLMPAASWDILTLDSQGTEIRVQAAGRDAGQAIAAISELFFHHFGEHS